MLDRFWIGAAEVFGCTRMAYFRGNLMFVCYTVRQLSTLLPPFHFHHLRQAMDHHIEKTADHQAQYAAHDGEREWRGLEKME